MSELLCAAWLKGLIRGFQTWNAPYLFLNSTTPEGRINVQLRLFDFLYSYNLYRYAHSYQKSGSELERTRRCQNIVSFFLTNTLFYLFKTPFGKFC